ncbi:MAG: hypothetical protein ACLRX5_02525 [Slackia sp.]
MTTALITAIVIVVVAGVALFVFFRSRSVKPNASVSKSVSSIGSGTPFQTRKGDSMAASAGSASELEQLAARPSSSALYRDSC